jgi:hypothetical protein
MQTIRKLSLPFSDSAHIIVRLAIGLAIGLTGIVNMLYAIVKPQLEFLQREWPIEIHQGIGYRLMVVIGFFLVMLSSGFIRGKYQAWVITLMLLVLSFVLYTVLCVRKGFLPSTLIALTITLTLILLICDVHTHLWA